MLLDPGRSEELPGCLLCELLPLDEVPGVLGVLNEPELLELIPDWEPLIPGEPMLLLPLALWRCCIAIVRVSDSTICSRRATRASKEPEPLTELPKLPVPELIVPLLLLEPNVPEPVAVEDCPKPPLAEEDVPLWPLMEPDAPALWREDDEPSCPDWLDWPGCPACDEDEPVDPMRELLEPLAPAAPLCPDVPVELPGVDCE